LQLLKLTIAVLAVALAGSASAAGWRSLRVDASNDASFATSVAEFEEKLSPARYQVFLMALKDVWEQGTENAAAQQSVYTTADYLAQIDGLTYEQVVTLVDPTGDTAKMRLRNAVARTSGGPRTGVGASASRGYPNSPSFGASHEGQKDPAGNPHGITCGHRC
jgi:hypothetical protein